MDMSYFILRDKFTKLGAFDIRDKRGSDVEDDLEVRLDAIVVSTSGHIPQNKGCSIGTSTEVRSKPWSLQKRITVWLAKSGAPNVML